MITVIETEHTEEKRNSDGTLVLEGVKHYEKYKYFLGIRVRKVIEHATIQCEQVKQVAAKPGFKKDN
jgi:hypothetical protein